MLLGEYMQTVDAKGRVNVPAKFRDDLGQVFVVSKGLNCVSLYPKDEWKKFLDNIISENPTKRKKLLRFFSSGSQECEVDSQGRVLIPAQYREYAGISKEIAVIGSYTYAEIWDRQKWSEYMDDPEFEAGEIEKAMEEYGL